MRAADRPNLRIDSERLWSSLMELAEIGGTAKGGVCRIALTDLDRRDLFVRWAKQAGCTIKVDQLGNIFARREGRDPGKPPVMTGSHLDTQPTGGKFDGAYGVMAGLEVLRVLHDSDYVTEAPIEVAVWTNEEGCRFAPMHISNCISSRGRSWSARTRRSASSPARKASAGTRSRGPAWKAMPAPRPWQAAATRWWAQPS